MSKFSLFLGLAVMPISFIALPRMKSIQFLFFLLFGRSINLKKKSDEVREHYHKTLNFSKLILYILYNQSECCNRLVLRQRSRKRIRAVSNTILYLENLSEILPSRVLHWVIRKRASSSLLKNLYRNGSHGANLYLLRFIASFIYFELVERVESCPMRNESIKELTKYVAELHTYYTTRLCHDELFSKQL